MRVAYKFQVGPAETRWRGCSGTVVGAALAGARASIELNPWVLSLAGGDGAASFSSYGAQYGWGQHVPLRRPHLHLGPVPRQESFSRCGSRSGPPQPAPGLHLAAGRHHRFDLPTQRRRGHLVGTRPHGSSPDTDHAARIGRFRRRHQRAEHRLLPDAETGHQAGCSRGLELADGSSHPLASRAPPVPGAHPPGFRARPAHAPDLSQRARTRCSYDPDAAGSCSSTPQVHSISSRACGIDVLPQHALWPGARRFDVIFTDRTIDKPMTHSSTLTRFCIACVDNRGVRHRFQWVWTAPPRRARWLSWTADRGGRNGEEGSGTLGWSKRTWTGLAGAPESAKARMASRDPTWATRPRDWIHGCGVDPVTPTTRSRSRRCPGKL